MPFRDVQPLGFFRTAGHPSAVATRTEDSVLLHISGQVARDDDGKSVAIGDARGQADLAFSHIRRIVEDQGGSMADICRLVIYVTDRRHLAAVTESRKAFFSAPYPAATAVIVTGLGKEEWLVEIEATAAL